MDTEMNNITSREEDEEFERMVRRLDWAEHILPKCALKSIDEPTKEWVGLMDEDMKDPITHNFDFIQGARWAEALLKERNK